MNSSAQIDSKTALRERARDVLARMDTFERAKASAAIQVRILNMDEFKSSECVLLYSAYGNEVRTDQILRGALDTGKIVYMPVFTGTGYWPGKYDPSAGLVPGKYGILEPSQGPCGDGDCPADLFIITPGLAFDRQGHRLGKGRGYYDRMLTALRKAGTSFFCAGLVYAQNLYPDIPRDESDVDVDVVVTENESVRCFFVKNESSFKISEKNK